LCAAELLSSISGRQVATGEIKVSDCFGLEPEAFAATVVGRLGAIVRAGPSVAVLEHVTSQDGLLLPILAISEHLRRSLPEVDLVIDGAQAAGLWRPPLGLGRAYLGCFHKYIDGPVGTGFCVLPVGLACKAPHRLRSTQAWKKSNAGEQLPTTDFLKWRACQNAVDAIDARAASGDRLAMVLRVREELMRAVPGEFTAHLSGVRSEYHSHILSFKTFRSSGSNFLWRHLGESGFITKQLDDGVRVTLHDTIAPESLRAFADALSGLASTVARF